MPTVQIPTANGPIDARLEVPAGSGPWPGVVVIHDAIGYGPDNAKTAARIAAEGYVTITPNLFSRGRVRCIAEAFRSMINGRGPTIDDILAARAHVLAQPQCSGSVGVVGFCMGGQFALLLSPAGFAASAPFYSTPLPGHLDERLDGACPIVASFGRRDPLGRGAGARLNDAVGAKGITADVKVYPGVGHSFANQLPGQPLLRVAGFGYDAATAEDAWRRVFAFFDTHLRAG